ncbi:hypothetical protein WJX72_009114 [[Myrmecia] bisecta]|uniref:Uncharacterized protein n=1 Tax=[Myrmecia] bisecta TaxID=41462 RepID=A0AAW1PE00_9CHLO
MAYSAGNPFGSSEPLPLKSADTERLYAAYFYIADADHDGKVQGGDAVKFFERSGLPRDLLAKVWAFSDSARRGYLDQRAFAKAMEYIAVAQLTGEVSNEAYQQYAGNLDPPRLQGVEELMEKMKLTSGRPSASPRQSNGAGYDAYDDGPSANRYPTPPGNPPSPAQSLHSSPASSSARTPNLQGPPPPKTFWKSGGSKKYKGMTTRDCTSIIDGLKHIYFTKIRPLEETYKFGAFFSSLLNEGDFEAKPSVLLLGQYSTGKTTFIKHLLGRDYPGINIGPEPTTDRFVVVNHALEERRTPGNTLIVQPDKPYQGLSQYGNGFLAKFEAASCPNKLLEEISLVDTPGVLSGEKQRIERTYNFIDVCGWFATRCDLILLLFDPHKLDISDEFKEVIGTLRGHDDKVRVVLNKADQVDQQQLMRVYGALMWSLSKVFRSPEVCRVYIGSFNEGKPVREDVNPYGKHLFEREQADLLKDLYEIPQRSCDRKVNEFVKRVRAAKIHILIMGHLRKQMPVMMGKQKAQAKMMDNLAHEFAQVQREYHLPAGDFPNVARYREILSAYDLANFPKLKDNTIKTLEDVLSVDIPNLVRQFDNPYG